MSATTSGQSGPLGQKLSPPSTSTRFSPRTFLASSLTMLEPQPSAVHTTTLRSGRTAILRGELFLALLVAGHADGVDLHPEGGGVGHHAGVVSLIVGIILVGRRVADEHDVTRGAGPPGLLVERGIEPGV